MVETQNTPEPPKVPNNAPAKKQEVGSTTPDSVKEAPEKAAKPGEKLKEVNQELQIKYKNYQEKKSLLDKASKKDVQAPGEQDAVDKSNAENTLKKMEDAYKKDEKTYQETIASDTTLAKKEKSTPEEQKKIESEGLTKSVTDLHYSVEPLDESRVQFLAKTFPEAWKNAIVDPNIDLSSNTELALVRERIQGKLCTTEQEIFKNFPGLSKEEMTKKLAENFQKVTGIPTNQEAFEKYILKQTEQIDSSPVDKNGKDTSSESFGPSATRGFSAGGSSDVPSASNGAENIPPVEASQMTKASYQWQGSGFKMRGPLKDVSTADRSPTLLAQLAKQGTNPGGSTGTCYKSVKNHLCAAGYVESSYKMTEGSAKNAGKDLSNIGFKEVGNAQPGDVLVYAGGKNEHGHIEIKTEDGYASDFFSSRASGRKLIGVWRPPISGPVGPQNTAGGEKKTQIS